MIDAPRELVAALPVARCYQEVYARAARQVRSREVLNQLLSDGIEPVLGNEITREGRIAIERIPDDFPRLRKIAAQHLLRRHEPLQDHTRPAAAPFVIAEVEGLVLADTPAGIEAEL